MRAPHATCVSYKGVRLSAGAEDVVMERNEIKEERNRKR
jgi:hypothetical protein